MLVRWGFQRIGVKRRYGDEGERLRRFGGGDGAVGIRDVELGGICLRVDFFSGKT